MSGKNLSKPEIEKDEIRNRREIRISRGYLSHTKSDQCSVLYFARLKVFLKEFLPLHLLLGKDLDTDR